MEHGLVDGVQKDFPQDLTHSEYGKPIIERRRVQVMLFRTSVDSLPTDINLLIKLLTQIQADIAALGYRKTEIKWEHHYRYGGKDYLMAFGIRSLTKSEKENIQKKREKEKRYRIKQREQARIRRERKREREFKQLKKKYEKLAQEFEQRCQE